MPGTTVRLPVRKGPVGDLLVWAAARWHREVEPLTPGWCWGYADRTIRGSSTTLSNHASGSAIDLNAPKHPLGVPVAKTFTPAQAAAVRRIVSDTGGALVWGGEWSRPDGMHLETVGSKARCAAVLAQLTGQTPPGDDMAPTLREGDGRKGTERGVHRWYVLSLQALINVRGLDGQVPLTGEFGPDTTALVKRLQQRAGLVQDGICGPMTWPVALGNPAPDYGP